ncbi:alpha/beta hydrolase [Paraburkholderia oxyphila]|uniref:alpha/beta hydrolase n=1 Tax=Paraburkholderia oxyphila TaxID=614212 RepID=UPI0005BE4C79|nr:alpha/beta fold hydrolase [Paraburkholderia oxyphila]
MTKIVPSSNLICEDFYLPSEPSSVQIHLRRKCLSPEASRGNRAVTIFVHGATFSGVSAFDTPLHGGSWLDFAAAHGHDAYAVDIRGYGLSSRPPGDDEATSADRPHPRTEEAILDLSAAVDFVLARTGVESVNLVGWSWGTAISGGYTARNNSKVRRLVMYAPLWKISPPLWTAPPLSLAAKMWMSALGPLIASTLSPYRKVTLKDTRTRWFRGVDASTAQVLCPEEEIERWWDHALSTDPVGASQTPPVLYAPNGVLADLTQYWAAGIPTYEPKNIEVPVLTILGEWDVDTPVRMASELFERLTGAPYKRMEVLGQGTHSMCLEVNRFELYRRVEHFLSSTLP